jgi:hypothetical protein
MAAIGRVCGGTSALAPTDLTLPQTGVANHENVGIASQRNCISIVHVALAATEERQEETRFDKLLS